MEIFEIQKPLKWQDFYSNLPMLACARFLEKWAGSDNPGYDEFVTNLSSDYFIPFPRSEAADAIFFGDVNAAMAPVIGTNVKTGAKNLLILKWLGAPVGFTLPSTLAIQSIDGDPKT